MGAFCGAVCVGSMTVPCFAACAITATLGTGIGWAAAGGTGAVVATVSEAIF